MRIKIELPQQFSFTTKIAVRITDLNYGNHVGNDAFLALLHEARMRFLKHFGASELDFFGVSLIMRSAAIEFKAELFYADEVEIGVEAADFSASSFTLYYKLQVLREEKIVLAAAAQTDMVCFDYNKRKVCGVPKTGIFQLK